MNTIRIAVILWIGALLFGCGKDTPKPDPAVMPQQVIINHADSTLSIGSADTLIAAVLPENASDKTLEWTSSDPSVISVNAQGRIEALKEGWATITATTKAGRISSAVNLRVQSDEHRVSGWFEYVTIPNRSFTAIEVYLANASNTPLTVKKVEIYYEYQTLDPTQSGTFTPIVPARSKSTQIFVHDSYSSHISWYNAVVFFEMNKRYYAMKIDGSSFETVRVEQITVGAEVEWDGENTIEIPAE